MIGIFGNIGITALLVGVFTTERKAEGRKADEGMTSVANASTNELRDAGEAEDN